MIVADTDVLIDFLRGQGPLQDRIAFELEHGLATTAITAFELWAGAVGSERRERAVGALLRAMPILPLDAPCARRAAEVRRTLEQQGRSIGMADSLIAGICVEQRAVLITRNRAHFERVPDLVLSMSSE
ncbi:MAG: type II toxin-antitoxin system VapC family toxin [Pseudomonadota bacterium]